MPLPSADGPPPTLDEAYDVWGLTATIVGAVAVLEVDARPLGAPAGAAPMLISDSDGEHDVHGCWSSQELEGGGLRLTFVAATEVASAQLWLWCEDTKAVGVPAPVMQVAGPPVPAEMPEARFEHTVDVEPRFEHAAEDEPRFEHAAEDEPRFEHAAEDERRFEHAADVEPRFEHAAEPEPQIDGPAQAPEPRFESIFDREALETGAFESPVAREAEPDAWPPDERTGTFTVSDLRHLTANVQRQHLPALIALAAAFIAFLLIAFTGVGPTAF